MPLSAQFSSVSDAVTVHLLDSSQGHPVQTWEFAGKPEITIGRGVDNDVVIADQHVSRVHARLMQAEDAWVLHSLGRHGTLVKDRLVAESPLEHRTLFRLGPAGPTLRFDQQPADTRGMETLQSIQPDLLAALAVDEGRKQAEVDEITSNSLFRELQEQSRRMKKAQGNEALPS